MRSSEFSYTTYIKTSPENLWNALTNPRIIEQYWFGTHAESDWKAGSPWKMIAADGQLFDAGEIVESNPLKRLVIKWRNEWVPEFKAEGYSLCRYEIEPVGNATKLTVRHTIEKNPSQFLDAVSVAWPYTLSNLKSLLETGEVAVTTHPGH